MEVFTRAGGGQDRDSAATKTFAEIVVTLAFQSDVQATNGKGAKRLSCRSLELDVDGAFRQACLTIFLGNDAAEHCRHSAIGILDGIVEGDFLLVLNSLLTGLDNLLVLHAAHLRKGAAVPIESLISFRLMQQTGEVKGFLLVGSMGGVNLYEFRVSDDFLQTVNTDFAEIFANLLG